jgi:putative toxin-antitoxin system antitoxin component (TIGR02293 family)
MASMTETERIVEMLGGRRTLGVVPKTEFDFIGLVRKGLPFKAFQKALAAVGVSDMDLSRTLRLPARTLARRKQAARPLSSMETERFLRFIRALTRASEVLGDLASALTWIRAPNRALGSVPPEELLDTDIGARSVMDILGRIEHGVYS